MYIKIKQISEKSSNLFACIKQLNNVGLVGMVNVACLLQLRLSFFSHMTGEGSI